MLIKNRDTNLSDIWEEIKGLNANVTAAESAIGFKAISTLPNPFNRKV